MEPASQGRVRQRERTRAALVEGALAVLRAGRIPSVSDAARASGVSRATAYRYFGDAASLLSEVLHDTVTPVRWEATEASAPHDAFARMDLFLDEALPIIRRGDPQLRAALRVALEQKSASGAGNDTAYGGSPVQRGTRLHYLEQILAPLRSDLAPPVWNRLVGAMATIVGVEARIVLQDICKLADDDGDEIVRWMAHALIRTANADATIDPGAR